MHSKHEVRYTAKNEKPSKVLLVCVYDTIVFQITNDIIRSKFEKFGTIKKLLIFEKGEVTKFFIELDEVENAAHVLLQLFRPRTPSTAPNSATPSAKCPSTSPTSTTSTSSMKLPRASAFNSSTNSTTIKVSALTSSPTPKSPTRKNTS